MVSSDWVMCMDKRPTDRSDEDLHIIYAGMKDLHTFEKFHPMLLQQLCYYSYYEDLEKGVTLFRQGDIGSNWYAVLSGTLDVKVYDTADAKNSIVLCKFGTGAAFGESVLNDTPRHATVVTSNYCELIRVEQKDFKMLWERNKRFMEAILNPMANMSSHIDACGLNGARDGNSIQPVQQPRSTVIAQAQPPNPAAPITLTPSKRLARAGHVIRTFLLTRAPYMIRDRKYHLRTYRRCMVGTEMVDWLLQQGSLVHSRNQAVGMWQALLEEGVLVHVCHEHQFKDKYLFYRFFVDDQGIGTSPTQTDKKESEEELVDTLSMLAPIGPDAMLRMILRELPHERSVEDLEIIYEELLHIKALSHLSTMVKRELASVLVFQSHSKAGGILFNQGDEGKSWYIILKGSVNVVIYGKGVVCTLHEGDDFGKLALVNDAPRAATIVLREDNCHFLRVDKEDFNRILRDVEANTVRLKEHGKDVLVLEKIPLNVPGSDGTIHTNYKYSVMAGTPDKMLEHLLETRISKTSSYTARTDTFLEDFLLTHVIFMPSNHLCPTLMAHYHAELSDQESEEPGDLALTNKKQVIQFVKEWCRTIGIAFWEDRTIMAFLEELHSAVLEDSKMFSRLREEVAILDQVILRKPSKHDSYCHTNKKRSPLHSRSQANENILHNEQNNGKRQPIKSTDTNLVHTYSSDHTRCSLKLAMDCTVETIITQTQDKLCLGNDLVLCEVKSSGEKIIFKDNDLCVTTGLSINGRLFVSPREHVENLVALPDQTGPASGTYCNFEMMSSREMAYQMTLYDWELCNCVHEYELIYLVFGRYKFSKITANLDIFLKRFNEIQLWVVTEMCLLPNLSKRILLLRKFIKIAAYCKEYQNLNAFFAIVMGLSNVAVSRLSQTWEKLPNKFKKMFSGFETLMDPSRNHRVYRLNVAKMQPPVIPFMPLLMKDMTFTNEGNKTHFDGLVNFEKMHMIAQTVRNIRTCRSKPLDTDSAVTSKNSQEIKLYIRNFKVIDNQRALTALSHKLEPRRS